MDNRLVVYALKRLTKRPKRHLIDPAVATADHYDTATSLGERGGRLGELFESVVVCQIRATAEALGLGWRFAHLRSAGGDREINLMADLPDGKVIAIEAKLSKTVGVADFKHLASLRDSLGESFHAGLLVHPGTRPFRLSDRIAATPLGTLV